MAAPDRPELLESAIRSLISAEAFEDARRLLEDYAAGLEREMGVAARNPELLLQLRTRVNEFFAWAETRTKAQRACDGRESARLKSLGCYEQSPNTGRSATA